MFGKEILVRFGRYAGLLGELVCSVAREQDVVGSIHYEAGERYGVADIFDERDGTGFERVAIHDAGVHFLFAFVSKNRAASGVEQGEIFK